MPAYRTRDTNSRSLEVTTDAPQPPTLAVISPTPRAFTFPVPNKPIDDSPYASPSSSPFEPDLRALALTARATPPPHLMDSLSPISPLSTMSSMSSLSVSASASAAAAAAHVSSQLLAKRRNSCDVLERRPRKGDEDYIKRPENAFILFRRKCCEDRQAAHEEATAAAAAAAAAASSDGSGSSNAAAAIACPAKKQRQADLSKTISQQWKSLPAEERQYWEDLAKEKKKEHEQMYPNYVYRPQRSKTRGEHDHPNGGSSSSSSGGSGGKAPKGKKPMSAHHASKNGGVSRRGSESAISESDAESLSFVLPLSAASTGLTGHHLAHRHGRSASAPTPPLDYQQITVPNVYMPSCPTSPDLIPMIARRASHPLHHPVVSHFDYLPTTDALLPPPLASTRYEPSLHSASYYQDMFGLSQPSPLLEQHHQHQHQHQHLHQQHQQHQHQQHPTLLRVNTLLSPSSTSSLSSAGSTSPCSMPPPFTPAFSFAPQQHQHQHQQQHDLASASSSLLDPRPLSIEHQHQHQQQHQQQQHLVPDYASLADLTYGGAFAWDAGLWPDAAGDVLRPEDLDIHSIPPIELTTPVKFGEDEQQQQQEQQEQQQQRQQQQQQQHQLLHQHHLSLGGGLYAPDVLGGAGGEEGVNAVVGVPCGHATRQHESAFVDPGLFGIPEHLMVGQGF